MTRTIDMATVVAGCPEIHVSVEDALSDHLLHLVLQLLPTRDLLGSACLVTRRWRDASISSALWRARVPGPLYGVGAVTHRYQGREGLRRLYRALYSHNLLLNPSLQLSEQLSNRISSGPSHMPGRGRTPWFTLDRWQWEGSHPEGLPCSTEGAPPLLPPLPLPQYAAQGPVRRPVGVLTSPNTWSSVMQIVDLNRELQRRGLPGEAVTAFLDASPMLELSLWHCGHEHGRARCEVWLALDDGTADVSNWLQAINVSSGRHLASATTGMVACRPAEWTRVRLQLAGYPKGCRRAFVILKGEGNSALLEDNVGCWGAKFAAPTLRLVPADEGVG